MKKLILVTSPPACGKTFVTKKLAKAMPNCVYLDKDSLIVLSKQIFVVANEEYKRMFALSPAYSTVGHGIQMFLCKKIIERGLSYGKN